MTMTGTYCSKCCDRLSFTAPRNEDEIKFYWAKLRRHGLVTRQGIGDNCGRETILTSYSIPAWVTQVGRVFAGRPSADVVAMVGWTQFFILTVVAALPGLWAVWRIRYFLDPELSATW